MNSSATLLPLSQLAHRSRDYPRAIEISDWNSVRTWGHLLRKLQQKRKNRGFSTMSPHPSFWWLSPGAKPVRESLRLYQLCKLSSPRKTHHLWDGRLVELPVSQGWNQMQARGQTWRRHKQCLLVLKMIYSSLPRCNCQLANYIYNVYWVSDEG